MEWVAQLAQEYGLFVALVAYVLWDSRQREHKYVSIIDELSKNFTSIKRDVSDIKKRLSGGS